MAWVVGVLLVVLVLVGMPLKYLADRPGVVHVVGVAHGFLFMVYLAAALHLALLRKWRAGFALLVLVSGTVPFLSFVMERQVTRRERTAHPR
jgi:integral membrane protein